MPSDGRHLDNWLAAIVRSANDGVIGKTVEGTILSWNPAAERIYGYAAQEVIGRHIGMLVPKNRPDDVPRILQQIRAGKPVENYETQRVTKDGRVIVVNLTISPVQNEAGQIIGASTVVRDITATKALQAVLREGEKLPIHTFAEGRAPSLLADLDDLTIVLANEAFARLVNSSVEELEGRTLEQVGLLETEYIRTAVERLREGQRDPPTEAKFLARGGEQVTLLAASMAVRVDERRLMFGIFVEDGEAEGLLESTWRLVREATSFAQTLQELYRRAQAR